MDLKKISTILVLSIALVALLGCVQQPSDNDQLSGDGQAGTGQETIGPDYYNSEAEAFDALGQELDGLEEPSAEDLEAMLG